MCVQLVQVADLRDRDEEVEPGELARPLGHPLLVGPLHQAEVMVEQIMTLERQEAASQAPLARADDLGDHDAAVVVGDPPRHPAEEGEAADMALPERLGALALERLDEEGVGVRQGHHEEGDLAEPAGDVGQGVAEVDLGLAGAVGQGDEALAAGPLEVADRPLHGRVAAPVALGPEPLEDPLGGVALLPGAALVLLEDPGDPVEEGPELGPGAWDLGPVARRLGMGEDLLECPPVYPGLAKDLALADAFDQDAAADVSPLQHVGEHLWASGAVTRGEDRAGPRSPSLSQRPR